ncbi:hypothetical protein PybrP1_009585 [[Pythium] brassicae (nom. inval.)]|nr:hypothetical protein PybrP1_009585 [[Pythium] brassicae (nom. inval.)]
MADVAAQFVELNGALKRENYVRAVEICNKIRSRLPDDPDAVRIKCVALIRLEKFDKALELAAKYAFLATERAYCLYRLKQDDEALALLPSGGLDGHSAGLLHLAAQLNYRRGNYETCIRIYEHLLAQSRDGDDVMELHANLLAAYASAGRSRDLDASAIPADESYEVAFNRAFIALEGGDWSTAEANLTEAEKLCRETLAADGASAAEVANEVALIKTQLAFVKQMRGDLDGALSDYRNVLKLKLSDQAVGAVASNNIVSIRKDRDLFDSLKRLKSISDELLNDKLSPAQQEAVLANRALVLCLMNKDQSPAAALELLQGDASVGGRLGRAHVLVAQGQAAQAAACLASIAELAHTPGTVATLVSLYEAAGDAAGAQAALDRALAFHKARDFASDHALKIRAGDCAHKIRRQEHAAAAAAYLDLLEGENAAALAPELRLRSLASLVVALSFCDAKAAETRCQMLPAVRESDVEPSELERLALRSNTLLLSKLADAGDKKNDRKRAAKSPEMVARKRTKRRDAHLAKLRSRPDFNASIGLLPPDPERWVPKKQRSYGKRGRRGRNRFVGAQGAGQATDKDALKLDAAARAASKASAPDRPAAVVVSDSSAVLRKAKKKKRR